MGVPDTLVDPPALGEMGGGSGGGGGTATAPPFLSLSSVLVEVVALAGTEGEEDEEEEEEEEEGFLSFSSVVVFPFLSLDPLLSLSSTLVDFFFESSELFLSLSFSSFDSEPAAAVVGANGGGMAAVTVWATLSIGCNQFKNRFVTKRRRVSMHLLPIPFGACFTAIKANRSATASDLIEEAKSRAFVNN